MAVEFNHRKAKFWLCPDTKSINFPDLMLCRPIVANEEMQSPENRISLMLMIV